MSSWLRGSASSGVAFLRLAAGFVRASGLWILQNKNEIQAVIRVFLALAVAFGLSACASKFRTYKGPAVTFVQVDKSARKMRLFHENAVLKEYPISLGFAATGPKQFENDGKTPEGLYFINRRNPDSRYHLSIGVSYPNALDMAFAESQGRKPGGDIFIHGRTDYRGGNRGDWTWGCIAVKDRQMEDVYAMVRDGTPIRINP